MGVVYCARNRVNGKRYIGQTVYTLEHRKRSHIHRAIHSKNPYNGLFMNALRKYGPDNFEWTIIFEDVPDDQLDLFEIDAIAVYNTIAPNGYNLSIGGSVGRVSESAKENNRKSKIGHVVSDETRAKMSVSGKNRPPMSPETRRKIGEATIRNGIKPPSSLGKSPSENTRKKISETLKGHSVSEETRRKLSIAAAAAWFKKKESKNANTN